MQFFAACRVQSFRTHRFKSFYQIADRHGFLLVVTEIAVEHPDESPLCPFVISRVAGTDFSVPIVREADLVHLFPVAVDIFLRRDSRVLPCLDGVLLCRQSVGIIPHGMQHVKTFQMLVTGIDIGSDVA